jgi:hypothetical protein
MDVVGRGHKRLTGGGTSFALANTHSFLHHFLETWKLLQLRGLENGGSFAVDDQKSERSFPWIIFSWTFVLPCVRWPGSGVLLSWHS